MTGHVLLRDVIESDLEIFFEHQADPQACQMAAFPSRERETFMTHWHEKILKNPTGVVKTILYHDQVAGHLVSWFADGERFIGYWLGRDFWGKGIATAALTQFLGHVKERPLQAHVARHNIGSRRVLEKCGFTVQSDEVADDGMEEYILRLD
jgi:RimJ/RimL family protein N-acetyltransferase